MTKSDQIVLALVRSALGADCGVDSGLFRDVNWDDVMDVAFEQGVAGIAFEGVELRQAQLPNLPKEEQLDQDSLLEWYGQVEYLKGDFRRHRKAVAELAGFYESCGPSLRGPQGELGSGEPLRMMLLKGYGLSLYWPVPEHRPVGDVDVYLFGRWHEGDRMVREKLGIEVESGHEHHTTFPFKGVMVENHYDFINTRAHRDARRIEARLKELASVGCREVRVSEGARVLLPSADFNVIFLIRHLGQHFAGERVTLRQLLDWGLFLEADGGEVNWSEVVPFLREMGIWRFFCAVCGVCRVSLGLRLEGIPEIERDEELEGRILEDVLHPEFAEVKPEGLVRVVWFKARRWWYNRWKHPLVYDEWLVPMFLTLAWSKVRRGRTIGD